MRCQIITLLIVLSFCCVLQGCETFKGAAKGFKKDVQNTKEHKGFIYDVDNWMREKMW